MPDGSASLVPRKRFSGERHPPDGAIFTCGADHAVGARPRAHGDTLRGEIQMLVDPARSEQYGWMDYDFFIEGDRFALPHPSVAPLVPSSLGLSLCWLYLRIFSPGSSHCTPTCHQH